MVEKRYIEIESCKGCQFTGHSTSKTGSKYIFIFVCGNPINDEEHAPREKIGNKYYPITGYGQRLEDNLIPMWCKLPSKAI